MIERLRDLIGDVDDFHAELSAWELTGISLLGKRQNLVDRFIEAGIKTRKAEAEVADFKMSVTWPVGQPEKVPAAAPSPFSEYVDPARQQATPTTEFAEKLAADILNNAFTLGDPPAKQAEEIDLTVPEAMRR